MKMEQTQCFETSACKIQRPGNYPEENVHHSEHGESLKSRGMTLIEKQLFSSFEATTEFSFSSSGLKLRINKLSVLKSLWMHFRLSVQLRVSRILLSLLHLQLQRFTSSRRQLDKEGFPLGFSFGTQ